MTNTKNTKRALLSSVVAMFLCFAMLLGTTYAWFTDSAVSANNKITAGTLDVELYQWNVAEGATEATATPISESNAPVFDANIIWEPGMTEVVYLSIKNNGTLALKYKVAIEVTQISDHDLSEVMYYAVTPDAKLVSNEVNAWVGNDNADKVNPGLGITETDYKDVLLAPKAEHFFALSIHMDEEAGNKYMGDSITFDIKVLAGQAMTESDSFGTTYDEFAGYPGAGFAPALSAGQAGVEIPVMGEGGDKVGSVLIPAGAAEDANAGFEAKISESDYEGNFTVAAGMETIVFDVSVSNIRSDNTAPVKTELRIPAGIDPATVKLYHYDTEISCNYDPYTGYVSFESTTFSPFTVVCDLESKYVPPVTEGIERPSAKVTYYADWVGTDIEWGNFGGFAPTEGLEATLDAAFIFECPELTDEQRAAYENWLCDFYVSLDRDLGANQIFLGGKYGSYQVGFHNGELTLDANQAIPLLGTAISGDTSGITNWTYADVESFVGEFTCGVGDVDGALEGATFTVCLRLINPEDTSEYYDVNVVTYTFGGSYTIDGETHVSSGDQLQDAINNGSGDIVLDGDIDLSESIVIPG